MTDAPLVHEDSNLFKFSPKPATWVKQWSYASEHSRQWLNRVTDLHLIHECRRNCRCEASCGTLSYFGAWRIGDFIAVLLAVSTNCQLLLYWSLFHRFIPCERSIWLEALLFDLISSCILQIKFFSIADFGHLGLDTFGFSIGQQQLAVLFEIVIKLACLGFGKWK